MKVSVIIPSFGMTNKLKGCIEALSHQTITPHEIIVVSPDRIELTGINLIKVRLIKVRNKTQISNALNLGIKQANNEIICFTDPDTLPTPTWIEQIINVYKDNPEIGGVGGRDQIYRNGKIIPTRNVNKVGRLTWYGRIIGNHHELPSMAMEVDFLKGCNMSFRRALIKNIDNNLLGFYRWEQDLCFQVKSQGYKLWYDPKIEVKHLKDNINLRVTHFFVISHNTTYILLKYLSWFRKLVFLVYTFLVGQRNNLGFIRSILLFLHSPSLKVLDLTSCCLLGKIRGVATFFKIKKRVPKK